MTPYEFLTAQPGLRGLTLDCDDLVIDANGQTLHIGAGTRIVITPAPGRIRVDFTPEPQLDLGWGVRAPIRIEVLPDGVDAVGRKFGIVKRQRLVMQEVPA